ncbi:BON domain-containing protein [Paraburkholderia sp. RP-4-7]|uniref:BON domain-containing protein n=1 Tax=Paraburkholderia polaris TaxID=2728848 RepID=A0A848IBY2_9BURK|nr:BON domain-containing protein [Paraburkholderia polaris]NML97086.1 BON domain-containing protein [Paraburkholderia polaris]
MKQIQLARLVVGVLILAGSFGAMAQNGEAASAPASTSAVSSKTANRALQKNVRRALSRSKGLSVANILVRAQGGAITLQGTVPESGQIDLATKIAGGVAGVTSVVNRLTVSAVGP